MSKSDSLEDVESKDLDTEKNKESESSNDEGAGIVEPEEVVFAREEISTLIAEEKRTSDLKADLQGKLQQTRKEVEALEELLPKKISSEENREILGLLCKVHELEITNAELQSNSLLRENLLRQKDLEMNKFESRQRLCDEIIQMQRTVINGMSASSTFYDCCKIKHKLIAVITAGKILNLIAKSLSSFRSASLESAANVKSHLVSLNTITLMMAASYLRLFLLVAKALTHRELMNPCSNVCCLLTQNPSRSFHRTL